ncbi:nuclear transport factor 2 (plasmid) [Novosphingobium aromaticivorans DSM 12444]|uniref:Nuclear transport factor 2 n=1 Tax=Novosphingobium aromaticivorans (strain ATCC 700278 / DSM 12444 / CCUG 56034 / CIP 105152 / NBRC 16084 / F199) TaxID=279238 RepID=A4XFB3_NOVAD|nr:steroid Delta-isomerase [Novosphingobium aromaticivorans]ABP64624.1 nuclear transport factor 2 [Novosphingobium aromaticivorans DSM 12444]SCY92135.1 steroid delta-isomerase [Novosphingobium aromaticivorans]
MTDPKAMEAAVHEYVAAFDAGAPERVAALFAEGATVEDPVGTPPHVGKAAILAFYAASMQTGAKLKLDGPVRICGPYAAFAFTVHLHWEGRDQRVEVIDTFRFDDDGKVIEMRAFFGPTNMHGFS